MRPQSLVLVTVDCLRADHAGFLGYARPTTSFLDSLATQSVVFRNAIVAGTPTYYSFPAIMASRYPLALGRDVVGLAPGEATLASVLRDAGYATGAFIAGNPYLSSRLGYDVGFDTFQDFLQGETQSLVETFRDNASPSAQGQFNRTLANVCHKLGPLGELYDEAYFQYCQRVASPSAQSLDALRRFPAADTLVEQAGSWLSGIVGQPFFLWLHFMDPHSPYYPPSAALRLMKEADIDASRARYLNSYWNRGDLKPFRFASHREEIIALYDAGIRWVDEQLLRLVEQLRGLQLWDDCVFAFTADHGEEFLDHGGRYHPPSKLTEELIRVPLLVRSPRAARNQEIEMPFSLLHLAPTLLYALQLQSPDSFHGRSQWAQLQSGKYQDEPALVECVAECTNPFRFENRMAPRVLAAREQRYKLIVDFRGTEAQLFDLAADPGEKRPLPQGEQKPVRRRLLEHAHNHVAASWNERNPELRLNADLHNLQLQWAQ